MNTDNTYDVIIAGGGLAGLALAILLCRRNYSVLVIEKDTYPRHKVCGEYISMESKPFLESLGLPVGEMDLPVINKLQVTDSRGNEINTPLPMGGFGISRYKLDAALAELAIKEGVTLLTRKKVEVIHWSNGTFKVDAGNNTFNTRVVCGTWGKRSKLDIKSKRPFTQEKKKALNNYIGIKYHINYDWPHDLIGLHNFTDGYCGISRIEDNKCCLCYLTTAGSLQKNDNNIKQLEREVLMKNPWLKQIFDTAEFLYESPMTISQISFQQKEQVLDHVLLLGDAAGVITPLCGNGMSMALHAAKLADKEINDFLHDRISRDVMEENYAEEWQDNFNNRTAVGRMVQTNFGKDRTTAFFIKAMKALPFVRNAIITGAAGKTF